MSKPIPDLQLSIIYYNIKIEKVQPTNKMQLIGGFSGKRTLYIARYYIFAILPLPRCLYKSLKAINMNNYWFLEFVGNRNILLFVIGL